MARGTIVGVTTLLFYLVIAAVIGLAVFFIAVFVFGRGEQMAPLDPRTSPAELPDHHITADDVRKIRFALALRGYRMSDVDWTLERLGDRIEELRREVAQLKGEPDPTRPTDHPDPGSAVSVEVSDELVTVGAVPPEHGAAPSAIGLSKTFGPPSAAPTGSPSAAGPSPFDRPSDPQ